MSGDIEHRERVEQSTNSGVGARSASPAKRSRADMEGDEVVKPSVLEGHATGETDIDERMSGMTPGHSGDADTQTTVEDSVPASANESMDTANTSADSLRPEGLPAYSAKSFDGWETSINIPSIEEQEKIVRQLMQFTPDEGQAGFIVSTAWLARVLSRTPQGLQSTEYSKEAREGTIGPIKNSSIVPEGAFTRKNISQLNKRPHIELKPGLTLGADYEILSEKAWGQVLGWYGLAKDEKQIVRYAHDTAPAGATAANMEYELNPPIFTICKVSQSGHDETVKPKSSLEKLKQKREQNEHGQSSTDDALRLVSSRSEKFQNFLKRAKEAAGIPFTTKVKIWRLGKPTAPAKGNVSGVPSPPQSRSTSPNAEQSTKLVIQADDFNKMEECEMIDGKDESGNANYNGSSTMDMYQLFEDATLVLEEQLGGPGGGEYASDKKPKYTIKRGVPGRSLGSKAPSAAPSRGVSPAPGAIVTRGRQRRDGRTRGTVGLSNLGNTCYMNSALQCIRSVEELAVYFLSGRYKDEINGGNPLGHGGAMARQYGNLLQSIYGDNAGGSFSPSNFKRTLGSLQPMFSGYGQQDSQEFLSFLVDAIHEDLNRIVKKPYNENPDSDDNTVHDPQAIIDLGEVYRANHRARNASVAMDLFNGFYKNTMECPDCEKISITFDPFSLVTVQLPVENSYTHTYTFLPLSGKPVNHDIDFDKNATVKSLKEYIALKHGGVEANRLWVAEVYQHRIYKVFEDPLTIAEANFGNDHIFFFELPAVPTNAPQPDKSKKYQPFSYSSSSAKEDIPDMDDAQADRFAIPVFMRQKSRFGNGWDLVMHPTYVVVTRDEAKSYETVFKKALVAVSRLTTFPLLTELEDAQELGKDGSDEVKTENGDTTPEDKEVSDRSASEDGYVEISKRADASPPSTNGDAAQKQDALEHEDRPIPRGFFDRSYTLSPAHQNQLFVMKYGGGDTNHCTGHNFFSSSSIAIMADRVKQPARRGSTDSGSDDDDESATSTGSAAADTDGDAEVQESGNELDEQPDIVIGGPAEDPMAISDAADDGNDSDSLPDNPLVDQKPGSKDGRKRFGGKNKGRRRKQKGYGKKERSQTKTQPNGSARFSLGGKSVPKRDDEDNPYYIKLGEGILLDWYPEALNHIFGAASQGSGMGGVFTSHSEGKGSIPTFKDEIIEAKRAKKTQRKKEGISLEECFSETGKREVLSEDNAWYCNRCKALRRATKTLEIWTIPDILVVHLKRFGGNRSFRDKIDLMIDYPLEGLDMNERVGLREDGKEYIYDLFAVDNHYGGLGGGHYTAYAKNFYDGQWYDYNDQSCSKASERSVKHNAAAYLLFYRRRSDAPLGPPYLQALVNEARNPAATTDNSGNEDVAEESDSGEGRLGGRANGSLRSSGGWNGAGAPAVSGGAGGARRGVGNSLMMTNQAETEMHEGDGVKVFYGPERPPHYGDQGTSSWSFSRIDDVGDKQENGSDTGSPFADTDPQDAMMLMNGEDDEALPSMENPSNDGNDMESNATVELSASPSRSDDAESDLLE